MPEINQSKNANTGEIKGVGGNAIFGDGNYSYRGHNIIINGGMSEEAFIAVCEKLSEMPHIHKTFNEENWVYQKFLSLDRSIAADFCVDCESAGNKLFYWHTDNKHQPDWLFDRVKAELRNAEDRNYQSHKINLLDNVNFENAKREIRKRFQLDSSPKDATELLNSLNKTGAKEVTHLLMFLIDLDEGSKQRSALAQFEKDFFDFWNKAPQEANFKVFLIVKLRPSGTWFARIQKALTPKKSTGIEGVRCTHQLDFVEKRDIDRFFEYTLNAISVKVSIKKPLYILDLWDVLCPEIYHRTNHGQTN